MFLTSNLTRADIEAALDCAGIDAEDYTIRDAYSGRGMYGDTCAAVDIPTGKLASFLTGLALQLAEAGRDDEAMDLAERVMTESMGLGLIVYWPDVKFAA